MIVLIAPERAIKNELEILHQLFQEGLQYYHLRKPNRSLKDYSAYLDQVDSKFHDRIVTHQYHELLKDYNLKGIHFQEAKRREVIEELVSQDEKLDFKAYYAELLNMSNMLLETKTMSASFHEPDELEQCIVAFDYHFLSPVFSSISKQGYAGRGFDVNHSAKRIVGMGGVTTQNLDEFTKLGFKGVGVLGGIWHTEAPISNFKKMRNYFTQIKSYI